MGSQETWAAADIGGIMPARAGAAVVVKGSETASSPRAFG